MFAELTRRFRLTRFKERGVAGDSLSYPQPLVLVLAAKHLP
jgi:hypothetical protein